MPRDILNRTTAPVVLQFFDLCFKQGVLDAYKYGDDYEARDFMDRHKEAWDFGVLGDPEDFDWELWRFTLYRWARRHHFMKFSQNFIYRIIRRNYLWYFLPYCMRFYLMGIEEWLEYPNPSKIELFKKEKKIHWKPVESHLRKLMTCDYISYMQEFCLEYRRNPLSTEERAPMTASTMDAFCMAIHDLTRGYDTGRMLRVMQDA